MQRSMPMRSGSNTARAACVTAWIALRTWPNHLCPCGHQRIRNTLYTGSSWGCSLKFIYSHRLQVCDRGTTATDGWNFCWAADILIWGISHYFSAFHFHVQSPAYLCPDPYLSPVSYHIPSPSSTEASVFKLIPLHSALCGEHFIVMGQYLGPWFYKEDVFPGVKVVWCY